MKFKQWLISEEIFPNKTATVYHRTRSIDNISSILTSDFKAGIGCMYGCGLYTTFSLESQFTNYMSTYGDYVVKFKVTDLDKYLIFQLSVAKQILGKDYKISDQLKKLNVLNKVDQSKLKHYDEQQEKLNFSSELAKEFYNQNDWWIEHSIKGILYRGSNDGYCLLKYPQVQDGTITMLGYAQAPYSDLEKFKELQTNKGWITSTDAAKIKSIYSLPSNKEKYSISKEKNSIFNELIRNPKLTLRKTGREFIDSLEPFAYEFLLSRALNKKEMALVLGKNNIDKLYPSSVWDLCKNIDEMEEILGINNIEKLKDLIDGDFYSAYEKLQMKDLLKKYNLIDTPKDTWKPADLSINN